jgi:hypothetical protein
MSSPQTTLDETMTITGVTSTAEQFCIWKGTSVFLCGRKNRPSVIGKTLPAGNYLIIPAKGFSQGYVQTMVTVE